jgi:ectoine hydroxylase-related dioxygenase (phytanoyl-CoA dioxygenase family)
VNPHPDSIGFRWRPACGPFGYLHADQVRAFDEQGFFVLETAFSREELAAVTAVLDPLERESVEYLRGREGGRAGISAADRIVFNPHAVARSARLREFARHPVLLGVVRDLIGADVRLYWDQLVYKQPAAEGEFPWHQDNGYTFVLPEQYITCWIALTDATMTNGCPWVLPGGHLAGTLEHEWTSYGFECLRDPPGAVAVELAAGSVVVFSSLTPHRTGPNTSAAVRKAYILQYAPDGAVMYPRGGEPVRADNPDWQFQVLRDGRPFDAQAAHAS